jgi:3-oxoacyl-[acyl-carrier protein] reductase
MPLGRECGMASPHFCTGLIPTAARYMRDTRENAMDLGLNGRTAIVCASSRGLGRGAAFSLARAGCTIILNGRDGAVLEQTAAQIRAETGVKVIAVVADVGTKAGQDALLNAAPAADILINNNGGPPPKGFRELDRAAMLDGVVQNMVTPIELTQAVIDGMIARNFGRIVNITSVSVLTPLTGLDLSSGARAGLTAFMAGVCREVAHANVTINNILPGMFDTDRLRGTTQKMAAMQGKSPEDMAKDRMAVVPAKRFGTPEEFGEVCAFLCSAQAGYITGQNILVDGGFHRAAF